ncbi:hypothetical protein T440DRAFT_552354 [Plenodomus tracheiphilus IPT5]|uniref:Uncharacterized protein n=1 Tax=Plenodomus tracheiphilus IPT5 TaxID=1408161 RepID=A0A6A7BGV1_9PLEO|nr:hypothetical protein T440DRAFT_552354 [Plenodomus tracheiphilus IPT5]
MNKPTAIKPKPLHPLQSQPQTQIKNFRSPSFEKGKAIRKTQDEKARALEKAIATALAAFKAAASPKILEQHVSVNLGGPHGPDEQSLAAIVRQFGGFTNLIQHKLAFDDAWSIYRGGQDITFRALNQKWQSLRPTFDLVKEEATMKVFQTQLANLEQANQALFWDMQKGGE